MKRVDATFVLGILFAASANGGAYNGGRCGAYGRLEAWQSLGALTGADHDANIDEVAARAERCGWFTFFAESGWFADVAWDVGIACLCPDGTELSILAATDTD